MNLDKEVRDLVQSLLVGRDIKVWRVLSDHPPCVSKNELLIESTEHFETEPIIKSIVSIEMTNFGSVETVGVELYFSDGTNSWTELMNENLAVI